MPLQLLPMEESDMYAYQMIFAEAFGDDLMAMMYPKGYSEEDLQWGLRRNLREWRLRPDVVKMMKVIDTDLPEDDPNRRIVGASKWKFYPRERTVEEMEEEAKQHDGSGWPPGANVQFMEDFFGIVGSTKKEIMGNQAYALLAVLITRPNRHRQGIGGMHLRWGLEEADKLGIQSYVEASAAGKPLYERMGYEDVKPLPLDAKKLGLDPDRPLIVCMIRPLKQPNGEAK